MYNIAIVQPILRLHYTFTNDISDNLERDLYEVIFLNYILPRVMLVYNLKQCLNSSESVH